MVQLALHSTPVGVDNAVPTWVTIGAGVLTLEIVARPGASRRRIIRDILAAWSSHSLPPPKEGKANDELSPIPATLRVARGTIATACGTTSRRKPIVSAVPRPR